MAKISPRRSHLGFVIIGHRVEGILSSEGDRDIHDFEAAHPELVHRYLDCLFIGKFSFGTVTPPTDIEVRTARRTLQEVLPPRLAKDPAMLGFAIMTVETDRVLFETTSAAQTESTHPAEPDL